MMKSKERYNHYPAFEEKINIISHAVGLFLSIVALVLLVVRASHYGNGWHLVSVSIFGLSLINLYAASTLYHSAKDLQLRYRLNIFDHASIYILIAGTYTPFTLVTVHGTLGWVMFGISWGFALVGVILKLFFTGKYDTISTIAYVSMGWIMVIGIKPLINNLPTGGLFWLVAGGLSYTFGAIIYSMKKMKFNHAIFHMFVLFGSLCHFISIYRYVLPTSHIE